MKKSDYFAEVISREIELRRRRAMHQLANDLSKTHAAEIEDAQKRVNLRIEAARKNLLRKSNHETTSAVHQEKSAYFSLRQSLLNSLLTDVRKELEAFAKSPKYENFLLLKINLLKADFAVVLLRPADMHFAEKIREATGLTPRAGDDEFLGGFILQSENGKIRADHTFNMRLRVMGRAWDGMRDISTWTDL
ncbi:MAG: V-type ATP synthase subunit E [Defluviitaleaceae bacterium]|nr:V-type ATP synthase subunit E [Defluviitaleaceae bacterium]